MTARRASRSFFSTIAKGLALLAVLGFGYAAYIYLTLPDVRPLVKENPKTTAFMEIRKAEARLNWASHVDHVYNIIRGANPAPGAWTTLEGKELQIFDARKIPVRTFGEVRGRIGEITEVSGSAFQVTAQGGRIEVQRAKLGDGKKVAAADLISAGSIKAGQILGG